MNTTLHPSTDNGDRTVLDDTLGLAVTTDDDLVGLEGDMPIGNYVFTPAQARDMAFALLHHAAVVEAYDHPARSTDDHQPWCDTEDACAGHNESGTHWGRRHVTTWDDGEIGGRNQPELGELAVRAALHEGIHPILDIEIDPATSGCDELMWLTPAEGRRFAAAILAAADELEGAMARRAGAA